MSTDTDQMQATFGGTPAETDAPVAPAPSTNGKAKPRMLTRAMMRDVKDFTITPVVMETQDGDVFFYVRSLSAADAFALSTFGDVEQNADGSVNESADNLTRMIRFITQSACNEDGTLLFTEPEDEAWLKDRKFSAITTAFKACMDVNGLSKEGMDGHKGN